MCPQPRGEEEILFALQSGRKRNETPQQAITHTHTHTQASSVTRQAGFCIREASKRVLKSGHAVEQAQVCPLACSLAVQFVALGCRRPMPSEEGGELGPALHAYDVRTYVLYFSPHFPAFLANVRACMSLQSPCNQGERREGGSKEQQVAK